MAEASYGVRSNTLKPLTNAQTVRGRPTSKHENERAFRKGSFRELLANISNVAIKPLQVLKRSVEQSLSTKYLQTMTSNDRSTLRNCTRNFDAGGCKQIFDNQHNVTAVMIIISYILYNVSSGLSVLSISLCTALVFCVIVYVRMLYTIALPTQAMLTMLNVLGKCDVLGEAMQPFVHHQHYRLGSQMKRRRIIASCKFRQTVRLTWFGKFTGTRKRVNQKKC